MRTEDSIKSWKNSSKKYSDGSESIEWKSKHKKISMSYWNGWNVAVTSLRKDEPPQLMADTCNTKKQAYEKAYQYMRLQ